MTLFALPLSESVRPRMDGAVVIYPEVSHHALNKVRRCCDALSSQLHRPQLILHAPVGGIQQSRLVPLWTLTILPLYRADVAELKLTSTGDMVAPMVEFDDGLTSRTGLPPFLFGERFDLFRFFVWDAVTVDVAFLSAVRACGRLAYEADDTDPEVIMSCSTYCGPSEERGTP